MNKQAEMWFWYDTQYIQLLPIITIALIIIAR